MSKSSSTNYPNGFQTSLSHLREDVKVIARAAHSGRGHDRIGFDKMKQIVLLGGYSSEVPPLPIPNREVKLTHADGTAYLGGRVGSRLFKRRSIISVFSFLFAHISVAPFLNGDLAVRIVLSKSPFFVTAYHKFCANIKIERPKIFS